MKLFSANIEDLRSLYIDNLQKALDMEEKIIKALPDLIEKSNDPALAEAFRNHLQETEVSRDESRNPPAQCYRRRLYSHL